MAQDISDLTGKLGRSARDISDLTAKVGNRRSQIGASPDRPIQKMPPSLTTGQRAIAMNLTGGNSAVAARFLQDQGFEVMDRGDYHISIREPGDGRWYVLDPSGFELQDIADVAGGAYTMGGTIAGGAGGAAIAGLAGLPSGPGALATGALGATAGAALGAGAAENQLMMLGRKFGVKPTIGEQLGAVGKEAAFGATAEVGGRLIGKGLQAAKPLLSKAFYGSKAFTREELVAQPAEVLERALMDVGIPEEQVQQLTHRELAEAVFQRQPGASAQDAYRQAQVKKFLKEHPGQFEQFDITDYTKTRGTLESRPISVTPGPQPPIHYETFLKRLQQNPINANRALIRQAAEEARVPPPENLFSASNQDLALWLEQTQPGTLRGGPASSIGLGTFRTQEMNPARWGSAWKTLAGEGVGKITHRGTGDVLDLSRAAPLGGLARSAGRGLEAAGRLAQRPLEKAGEIAGRFLGGGVEGYLKRRAGQAMIGGFGLGLGAGLSGVMKPVAATVGGLYGVGAGLRALGHAIGPRELSKALMDPVAPSGVKAMAQKALMLLQKGDKAGAKSLIYVLMHSPTFRAYFGSAAGSEI